jgi:hypothetical protein
MLNITRPYLEFYRAKVPQILTCFLPLFLSCAFIITWQYLNFCYDNDHKIQGILVTLYEPAKNQT